MNVFVIIIGGKRLQPDSLMGFFFRSGADFMLMKMNNELFNKTTYNNRIPLKQFPRFYL